MSAVRIFTGVLLSWFAASSVDADVLTVTKGFVLGPSGSVTATASESISGRHSIKGSYFGTGTHTRILQTDASIVGFAPNQAYVVSFRYRVITVPSTNFEVLFFSPTAAANSSFIPSEFFGGSPGSTGTVTLKRSLGPYSDYAVIWSIGQTGEVLIDDIQIVKDSNNEVIAAEDAEGPHIIGGPLNFQILESQTFPPLSPAPGQSFTLRSASVQDLDGDGRPEVVITLTTYPDQVPQPPVILGTDPLSLETQNLFPGDAPTVRHSPLTLFADVDGNGLKDMLLADAGLDHAPWTGSRIAVALNAGRGVYRDVSPLIPMNLQTTRSYALAAADLDGNGRAEILLPDQSGSNPTMLEWSGAGFAVKPGVLDARLWQSPTDLRNHSWVGFADLDGDGRQDLVVTGQNTAPTWRVVFGSAAGFAASAVVQLPEGLFGHAPASAWNNPATPIVQGGDVNIVAVADFNNDGKPDLFALEEQAVHVQPGAITDPKIPGYTDLLKNGGTYYGDIALQVLMNDGGRRFRDYTAASSAPNLGKRNYQSVFVVDLNGDGALDVGGIFHTKAYGTDPGNAWGTTFFINDGSGAFQIVDGVDVLPVATTNPPRDGHWSLGSFVPTAIAPGRTEGLIIEPLADGGVNVYRVASAGSIGAMR